MIHVCLLRTKTYHNLEFETFIKKTINPTDLVIYSDLYWKLENQNVLHQNDINFEELSNRKITNLLLISLNRFPTNFLTKIITLKSKKTEIFAVGELDNEVVDFLLEIQEYRDAGLGEKEILLLTRLKYNYSDNVLNYGHYLFKNSKIREIKNFGEIKLLWKN